MAEFKGGGGGGAATAAPASTPAAENPMDGIPPDVARKIGKRLSKAVERATKAERERDEARGELEAVRKRLPDLEKAAGEVETLKGEIRTGKHRAAFAKAAKERGVADADVDDLYKLSDYKAEGDTPDDAAIGKLLDDQKEKRPRFFAAAAGGGESGDGTQGLTLAQLAARAAGNGGAGGELRPGPARGQGGHARHDNGKFQVTKAQQRDPAFCFRQDYRAALAKGTVEVID